MRRVLPTLLLLGLLLLGLALPAWARPAPGSSPLARPQPLRVAVLSDVNGAYGSTTYPAALGRTVARLVGDWKPDLVLSAGDLIAGQQASQSDALVRAMWAAFERDIHAPLRQARVPFVFALGNHDASLPRDRREAQAYWSAHRPAVTFVDQAQYPFRYSVIHAGVFIAVLDASGPQVSAEQRAWLAAQLAGAQARAAGIRLVVGHLPLSAVSAGKNKPGEVIREAAPLREVMVQGRVLAYISGHHAAYYPGRLGDPKTLGATPAGLNVLASGGLGGRDYVGHPGTARSTVTLLNLWPDQGRATFQTFDADNGELVPTESLPSTLSGLGGTLRRVTEFR